MELPTKLRTKDLLKHSNRPVIIAVTVLVLVNVLAAFTLVLPQWNDLQAVKAEEAGQLAALQMVQAQFSSEKISEQQIGELAVQVPFVTKDSDSLLALLQLAIQSRTVVTSIVQTTSNSASSTENSDGANQETQSNSAASSEFTVTIAGHMENTLQYLRQVNKSERIIINDYWTMKVLTSSELDSNKDLRDNPNIDKSKPVYITELRMDFFSLPQYSETLLGAKPSTEVDEQGDVLRALQNKYSSLAWE